MGWEFGRRSTNVEDRRGKGVGTPIAVGGGIGAVILSLIVALLGGDPSVILELGTTERSPVCRIIRDKWLCRFWPNG